ncbi:UNKNOWN [Stylonychia lemnae]|uniref:Uncharacterized protein n=1 Tax=Stylonychia lemnae TaxID=5949 RepID=A0A078AP88_STYLE|nr:UNKNOWN [Stylonychia lemnae]|eukprot:CDW83939.1 UNKNOWN [Stylonychia lemnae]
MKQNQSSQINRKQHSQQQDSNDQPQNPKVFSSFHQRNQSTSGAPLNPYFKNKSASRKSIAPAQSNMSQSQSLYGTFNGGSQTKDEESHQDHLRPSNCSKNIPSMGLQTYRNNALPSRLNHEENFDGMPKSQSSANLMGNRVVATTTIQSNKLIMQKRNTKDLEELNGIIEQFDQQFNQHHPENISYRKQYSQTQQVSREGSLSKSPMRGASSNVQQDKENHNKPIAQRQDKKQPSLHTVEDDEDKYSESYNYTKESSSKYKIFHYLQDKTNDYQNLNNQGLCSQRSKQATPNKYQNQNTEIQIKELRQIVEFLVAENNGIHQKLESIKEVNDNKFAVIFQQLGQYNKSNQDENRKSIIPVLASVDRLTKDQNEKIEPFLTNKVEKFQPKKQNELLVQKNLSISCIQSPKDEDFIIDYNPKKKLIQQTDKIPDITVKNKYNCEYKDQYILNLDNKKTGFKRYNLNNSNHKKSKSPLVNTQHLWQELSSVIEYNDLGQAKMQDIQIDSSKIMTEGAKQIAQLLQDFNQHQLLLNQINDESLGSFLTNNNNPMETLEGFEALQQQNIRIQKMNPNVLIDDVDHEQNQREDYYQNRHEFLNSQLQKIRNQIKQEKQQVTGGCSGKADQFQTSVENKLISSGCVKLKTESNLQSESDSIPKVSVIPKFRQR